MARFNCKRCTLSCAKEIKAQRILQGACNEYTPYIKVKNQLMETFFKDIENIDYLDKEQKQELKVKFLLETNKELKL